MAMQQMAFHAASPAADQTCTEQVQWQGWAYHGGEQAGLGRDWLGAGVQQQEAAGAVGVLGFQRPAALPQHGRLLVAQATCSPATLLVQAHGCQLSSRTEHMESQVVLAFSCPSIAACWSPRHPARQPQCLYRPMAASSSLA